MYALDDAVINNYREARDLFDKVMNEPHASPERKETVMINYNNAAHMIAHRVEVQKTMLEKDYVESRP